MRDYLQYLSDEKKSVFLKITGHFLALNWIFCLFQVNCLADGVLVDIDLRDKNFNGVMYVKGHRNDQVSVILCSFIYGVMHVKGQQQSS